MSAHIFMTGRLDMSLSVKKEALLENEKENYEYDYIDENGKVICLYNSGEKSVEILCDEDGFVVNESLFKNGKKYLVNYYTDSLSYTELYNWDNDSNDGLNLGRRIFGTNKDRWFMNNASIKIMLNICLKMVKL